MLLVCLRVQGWRGAAASAAAGTARLLGIKGMLLLLAPTPVWIEELGGSVFGALCERWSLRSLFSRHQSVCSTL